MRTSLLLPMSLAVSNLVNTETLCAQSRLADLASARNAKLADYPLSAISAANLKLGRKSLARRLLANNLLLLFQKSLQVRLIHTVNTTDPGRRQFGVPDKTIYGLIFQTQNLRDFLNAQ